MKMVREFIIKDILDYEIEHNVNLLEELEYCNVSTIIDLISLGNDKCGYEEAEHIFDIALKELGISGLVEELAYELVGKRPNGDEETTNSKKYSSFSEVLESFYNEIQAVDKNLGLSDFWNISTRYMYRYADGLQQRFLNDKNIKLQDDYTLVAMFIQGIVGKLKECPQLDENGNLKQESEIDKLKAFFAGRSKNNG